MKSNVLRMALLLAAFVSVCFVSCKGDDESDGPNSELVGTWEFFDEDYDDSWRMTVTINGNGTYTATQNEDGKSYSGSGKWSYKDGYLYIELPDGEDKYQVISVSSKELVIMNFPVHGRCVWKRK